MDTDNDQIADTSQPDKPPGNGKQRELITLPDGRQGWQYPSGVVLDPVTARIMKPSNNLIQSSDDARERVKVRWDGFREAAARKVTERFQERGLAVAGANDAWGEIISKRADVALDNEGRTGNDAARLVGQALGALQAADAGSGSQPTQVNVFGADVASILVAALADRAGNRDKSE